MKTSVLSLALSLSAAQAAETIVGVYILSRHGDRTDKSHPPTKLTDLGYKQVLASGEYYRHRYISSDASSKILGISSNAVSNSQIYVSATDDTVLMNSAQGFLQGLYPPIGQSANETLRNGTTISDVNGGYQLIPLHTTDNGVNKEDATWLQGTSGCDLAIKSSKAYTSSPEYKNLLNSTQGFYQSLDGVWSGTFTATQSNFSNAYAIFDVVNVAMIHNSSIPSSDLLTNDSLLQLRTLADNQQFNLAYNASEPVRAIQGSTFAAEVLAHLNDTITSGGKSKIGIQFNAYATFQAFFGLAQLPVANPDFYGIPDYASSMVFELFTNDSTTTVPDPSQLNVRFLFHNGSTINGGDLTPYPLFGQKSEVLSWSDFVTGMNAFAVTTQQQWCTICGNSTGTCAAYSNNGNTNSSGSSGSSSTDSSGSGSHMSNAVAGVIGAVVALAVILIAEGLIFALAGLAIVRKKNMARAPSPNSIEKQPSVAS